VAIQLAVKWQTPGTLTGGLEELLLDGGDGHRMYHNSVLTNLFSISDSGYRAHLDGIGGEAMPKQACDFSYSPVEVPEDLTALLVRL